MRRQSNTLKQKKIIIKIRKKNKTKTPPDREASTFEKCSTHPTPPVVVTHRRLKERWCFFRFAWTANIASSVVTCHCNDFLFKIKLNVNSVMIMYAPFRHNLAKGNSRAALSQSEHRSWSRDSSNKVHYNGTLSRALPRL